MRMRKKKNRDQRLEACSEWLITEPAGLLALKEHFPIEIEIGCGKGGFICQMAQKFPDKVFIAVEVMTDAIISALEKCKELDIHNVYFINCDAKKLVEFFENGQVSVIYLNFSDPWPKAKHAKRRLTFKTFLECYKQLLCENGRIEFKTDNRPLFDFSLEQMQENEWRLEDICYDVHNSPYNENNIRTEYENNFSAKGFTINRVVAYKQ